MKGFNEGKRWEAFKKVQVVETGGIKKVFVKGQLYMSWESADKATQRVAIVQLYECELGTQEELAEAFGISVKSVYNYIIAFASGGTQELTGQKSGPKQNWKLTPQLRAKILVAVLKEGIREYAAIQERLKSWNAEVSIESIRQVLLEDGLVKDTIAIPGERQRELFEIKDSQRQWEFEFPEQEENSKETPLPGQNKESDSALYRTLEERKDRSFYSSAQRVYLDQLEQGEYSTYAGGLLFTPLLEQYNFLPMIKRIIDIETHEGYSLDELCLTLFYFDLFRFPSMENFKTVYPEEFGVLMGRLSNPSIFTLRRFLHKVRKLRKSESLIDEFAKGYLKRGIARWGVLYINSHFLAYYGIYPITMGWHGVRKIPMKGSYNFLSVDERFTPLLFLIRSSSEDLLQKIPEIILKAKRLAREVGIGEEEAERLIVIFDREGYSAELFRILDAKDGGDGKAKVIFISFAHSGNFYH